MKRLLSPLIILLCGALIYMGAHAQTSRQIGITTEPGQNIILSDSPGNTAYQILREFNGDNNPTYEGYALTRTVRWEWSIGNGLTSIVDATNTATVNITGHCLASDYRVWVDGASDTDLNSTNETISAGVPQGGYKITVTGANAFTFTSANVTDATYNAAGLKVWTYGPRTCDDVWKIRQNYYTLTNPTGMRWAEGNISHRFIWDSRSTYAYE